MRKPKPAPAVQLEFDQFLGLVKIEITKTK
jgi:hypothetical protein